MPEQPKIRVLLADDHQMVRDGLKVMLTPAPDVEIVGEAPTGELAYEMALDLLPDVILMDVIMPGAGGPAAIRRILQHTDGIHIVAMSSFSEVTQVRQALDAGAIGYMLKDASSIEVITTVRDASQGKHTFSEDAMQAVIAAATSRAQSNINLSLTNRENDVLHLLTKGLTNAEIGQHLDISEHTVKFHVSSILSKFGASSRTEAVAMAVKNGLISE